MKRVFLAFMIACSTCFGAAWDQSSPAGTTSPSDLDTNIQALNSGVARGLYGNPPKVSYSSASEITVSAGSATVCNVAMDDCEILYNPSATTVGWSDIDTGAEENSTTYYVYTTGSSSADTFSVKISKSSTAPSGSTQYKRIGSLYNDSSGNITKSLTLTEVRSSGSFGSWQSKSNGATYLATTDGIVTAYVNSNSDYVRIYGYTDSSSSPSTCRALNGANTFESDFNLGITMPVRNGDYWVVTGAETVQFLSLE